MQQRRPLPILRFLVYYAAFAAVALAAWIQQTFGAPSIDQILYHLRYSEGAAVQMSRIFVFTLVIEVLCFPLGFALAAAIAHAGLSRRGPPWWRRVLRAAPAAAIAWGVAALLLQFSAFSYAAAHFGPDRFAERHVDPEAVRLQAERPRNLVVIYAESLEDTYGDPAAFGSDLLAPLRQAGGQAFPNYGSAEGTTWTMAGIVATQCGVPLKVYSEYDIRRPSDTERVFLPGATCLGDLLQARGYRSVFLGGAPLSFAGKGSFLRDHGYDETWGRDEWERAGARPTEMNEWGLYDNALLERARDKLDELHAAKRPFLLTVLTLDTHNPHGFLSPSCRARGARNFEGIVGCAAGQLSEFVQFARDRGYLNDTTIVVIGDHLAVPNPAWDKLRKAARRSIFNLVVAEPPIPLNRPDVVPFDWFPTLVELAGFQVEGDRLGLGYSAAYTADAARPMDRGEIPLASLGGSTGYQRLWKQRRAARAAPHRTGIDTP
jgi:phosphoglycerol transferase